MSSEFEQELRERIGARAAAPEAPRVRRRVVALPGRLRAWLGSGMRARVTALAGISAMAAIVTLAIAAPWRGSNEQLAARIFDRTVPMVSQRVSPAIKTHKDAPAEASSASAASSSGAAKSETAKVEPTKVATPLTAERSAPESSSERVQQRAATLTLAPKPAEVQPVADRIAQLAARDGGFVQSSQVRLQRGAGGEANLQLSLPSARLSAALAELARLAPTRAQSQSLQDITDEYGAARAKLADAVAARQALLRALARASTQGAIESLRARLALAGGDIVEDRTALAAVSKRGSNSTVEVNVLGDAHAGSDRSTLATALHDAGDVLKVALAVLIVALAVLVPLALLALLGVLAWRASRRRLRERALS